MPGRSRQGGWPGRGALGHGEEGAGASPSKTPPSMAESRAPSGGVPAPSAHGDAPSAAGESLPVLRSRHLER